MKHNAGNDIRMKSDTPPRGNAEKRRREDTGPLSKKIQISILIIDDEEILRKQVKAALKARISSVVVHEAWDEEGMWHAVTHHRPGLVFMDIQLSGQNGLTLTRRLKSCFSDIKVAVWSGNDDSEYRRAADDAGADFFISKKTESIHDLIRMARQVSVEAGAGSVTRREDGSGD